MVTEDERARNRAYYLENRTDMLSRAVQVYYERRSLVLDHYGRRCACCGETETVFLTIDHIDESGAAHRKSLANTTSLSVGGNSRALVRWLIDNDFPEGFQVLCFNCNFAKHRLGVCPHQVTA